MSLATNWEEYKRKTDLDLVSESRRGDAECAFYGGAAVVVADVRQILNMETEFERAKALQGLVEEVVTFADNILLGE